jgi:hypothetical protein
MKKKPYAPNTLEPGMLRAEEGDTIFRRFTDDDNRRISQALEKHVNESLADTRAQVSQELKDLASTTQATLMLIAATGEAPNQNKLMVYWISGVNA